MVAYFYVYLVCLVFRVDLGHGGGWRVWAKNEGRMARVTQKWGIVVVKSEIYRPMGVRSDPMSFRKRRNCLAYLVHGGGIWSVPNKQQLAITQKSRELAVNIGNPLISGPVGKISPIRSFNSLTDGDFSPDPAADKGKNGRILEKVVFGDPPAQFRLANVA